MIVSCQSTMEAWTVLPGGPARTTAASAGDRGSQRQGVSGVVVAIRALGRGEARIEKAGLRSSFWRIM